MTATTLDEPRDPTTCPVDGKPKLARQYVCRGCWATLQPQARTRLNRRDDGAFRRLAILNEQIDRGVPLREITIPLHVS